MLATTGTHLGTTRAAASPTGTSLLMDAARLVLATQKQSPGQKDETHVRSCLCPQEQLSPRDPHKKRKIQNGSLTHRFKNSPRPRDVVRVSCPSSRLVHAKLGFPPPLYLFPASDIPVCSPRVVCTTHDESLGSFDISTRCPLQKERRLYGKRVLRRHSAG